MKPSQPGRAKYSEPLRVTLLRTVGIAVGVGSVITLFSGLLWQGSQISLRLWVSWTVAVFWFSFGGHWVEIVYLNYARMILPPRRWLETVVRLLVWFAGGCVLFGGMKLTSSWLGNNTLENVPWYVGGLLFIIVELCVHAIMAGLKRDNFWNGRG